MSWAHTSELDRLRLCQRTATDLRGFHLQNPPFLCMLMCLCTQWQQECTWQSMCTVVWITVHMNECVCVNKWLPAPMAQWFCSLSSAFFSVERLEALFCFLFFSRSFSFLPSCFFSLLPHYFLLSRYILTLNFPLLLSLSLSITNIQYTSCCELWR